MIAVLHQFSRTNETYLERHRVSTVGRLADRLVNQVKKLLCVISYKAGKESLVLRTALIGQKLGKTGDCIERSPDIMSDIGNEVLL